MKFATFKTFDGQVEVNLDNVEYIKCYDTGGAIILFVSGKSLIVENDLPEVIAIITQP